MDLGLKRDIQYWIDISKYDLDTAQSLLDAKRYLYVLFMCQQSLEKMFKAIVTLKTKEFPPRIHNLIRLAELAGFDNKDIDMEFLDKLSFYYIETRYPEEHIKLHKQISKKLAGEYYRITKRTYKWLEKHINLKI